MATYHRGGMTWIWNWLFMFFLTLYISCRDCSLVYQVWCLNNNCSIFTLVSSASAHTYAGGHELSLSTGNAGGRLACGM